MHTERNKRLAREWYELIGSARYEEAKAYVSEDFEFYPMIDNRLEGVYAFIELESSHMDPQPGFHFEILKIIGEGDLVYGPVRLPLFQSLRKPHRRGFFRESERSEEG